MHRFRISILSYIKFVVKNGFLVLGIFFCISSEVYATTFYISPDGSNSNSGTSTSSPWRTFRFAISRLQAGDTLIVKDGAYTKSTTGLPEIRCGKNARNGTPTKPITIKAENERQAFLQSDGSMSALAIWNCSYWKIEGIRARSNDLPSGSGGKQASVVMVKNSNNIILRRLLVTHNNRYFNDHNIAIEDSSDSLVEECEVYYHHRHGIMAFHSNRITVRRSYVGERGWNLVPGAGHFLGGQESISMYGSSDGIIENCIAEDGSGFEIHGVDNAGKRNKVLGCVALDTDKGYLADSRGETNARIAEDNQFINNVSIRSKAVREGAFQNMSGVNNLFQNVTAFESSRSGFADVQQFSTKNAADCTNIKTNTGKNCSFELVNALIINSNTRGIRREESQVGVMNYINLVGSRTANYFQSKNVSDSTSKIRNSMSVTPIGMGLGTNQCIVYVPKTSNMKGAGEGGNDIGANIIYRYVNGKLTNEKLWNQSTGQFPCGATVTGVNDDATFPNSSCVNVHKRLNVGVNGCPIP